MNYIRNTPLLIPPKGGKLNACPLGGRSGRGSSPENKIIINLSDIKYKV
jgi:hypothetical protein